jgi:hypothetical protein
MQIIRKGEHHSVVGGSVRAPEAHAQELEIYEDQDEAARRGQQAGNDQEASPNFSGSIVKQNWLLRKTQ